MSGYVTQEISICYLYLSDQVSTHKERTRRKTEKLHRRCLTGISNSTIYIQWMERCVALWRGGVLKNQMTCTKIKITCLILILYSLDVVRISSCIQIFPGRSKGVSPSRIHELGTNLEGGFLF